ncbi:hypothetical protein XM25_02630 [Devosia sp. H5989]|nr:hypothetical protein XM25_02630 [Devosia sp. H5989]
MLQVQEAAECRSGGAAILRFILKSAFWLTVAFMVIRPGVDLPAAAGAVTSQALAAGQSAIVQQIDKTECDTLQCVGGKALLSAAVTSAALPAPAPVTPMQISTTEATAPVPRPRPAWLG